MEAKDPFDCSKSGDVDFFKTVAPDFLLKARDGHGDTVLTVAALEGHLDCCEVIVERCTPLLYHQQDTYYKWSVLHWVVAYDGRDNNVENIMRFLITADSKPDLERGGGAKLPNHSLLTMQDNWRKTALHLAVERRRHRATKLLLEADRDFELLRMVDNYGRTCLHLAAEQGDLESAELMIKAMPDIEFLKMTERKSNKTALHIAAEKGNLEMVTLIREADPDKQLLSMPDSHGNTPLHLAVRDRKVEIVRLLTEADMKAQRRLQGAIPCAKSGDVGFFKTVPPNILLRTRDVADINTVLTWAARKGHLDCCKVIVERCTPLLYHQDKYKWSVLHCVIAYDEDNNVENIMRFLITADSKPDLVLGGGAKLPNKRLLTMQTRSGATALHFAVRFGKHRATKLLLQADRDFELLRMFDNNGRTCLHIAVEKGDHVLVKLLE